MAAAKQVAAVLLALLASTIVHASNGKQRLREAASLRCWPGRWVLGHVPGYAAGLKEAYLPLAHTYR